MLDMELAKLLRLLRIMLIIGVCGYAGVWALGFTWLAFNH